MAVDVRQQIADEFKNLSAVKDPGKITVKDLVTRCGVSRQTFYYYYQDIYDVIAFVLEQNVRRIADESTALEDARASAEHFVGSIMDDIPMFRRVFDSKLRSGVETMLLDVYRKYLFTLIENNISDVRLTAQEMYYLCDFLACSLLGELISNCAEKTIDVPEYCRQMMLLVHGRVDNK